MRPPPRYEVDVLAWPRALAARSKEPLPLRENASLPPPTDEADADEPVERERVELTTFAPVRESTVCL